MGVTAITGKDLERQRATSFADYVALVPGLSYVATDPGHTRLTIRGINAGGIAANVATYVDETPYGSSSGLANGFNKASNLDTFDIQRIEVLRGPQGTLYGANALGGLLKFVTNKPDPSAFDHKFEFGGSTVENGDSGGFVKGMINVPFAEDVALRAVGYYREDPGYIDDPLRGLSDINSAETVGGRATMLFEPSDNFSITLTAAGQNIDADAVSVIDASAAALPNFVPLFGDLTQSRNANEFSNVQYRVYNGTANWDLGWAQLTSATSWGTYDEQLTADVSIFALFGFGFHFQDQTLEMERFTQEVRLASPQDGRSLEWLFGLYYTDEDALIDQGLVAGAPGGPEVFFATLDSTFSETAVFADFIYHFSPAFDVELGGRYSSNDQSATTITNFANAPPPPLPATTLTESSAEEVFTYSVAPKWKVDEDTILYARVASGYRPGGPNVLAPGAPPGTETFDSDTTVNYEIGIKTDLLDGRLLLDADVYFIDWSNIQLPSVVAGFVINGNGGGAESQGFELAAAWAPIDEFTIRGNAAYTDAKLTTALDPLIFGPVPAGAELPFVPEWTATIDADYTLASIGSFEPFVGGGWRYVGDRVSGFSPDGGATASRALDPYHTFDLRAGVVSGEWTVQLYAKNVGDERGLVAFGGGSPSSFATFTNKSMVVATPRTIGISVTGKF